MLWVASPSPDGRSYFTEVETGSIHRTYKCDPMPSSCSACFSRANNVIVVPQAKNAIFLYSIGMQQPIQKCFTPEKISASCVSPCGNYVLGGGAESGSIYTWVIVTGELLCITKGHMRAVTCIAFSADGTLVATASQDSVVKVWRLGALCSLDASPTSTFSGHTLTVNACAFFNFSTYVATVSRDRSCRIFDAISGTQMLSIAVEEPAMSIAISGCDSMLVCGGEKGLLSFIKPYTPTGPVVVKVPSFADGHKKTIMFVAALPDLRILTCSDEGVVLMWDASGEKPQLLREVAHVKHGICAAFIVPCVSMKMLQDGTVAPPTPDMVPVLSKYPANTTHNDVRFWLPARSFHGEIAVAESTGEASRHESAELTTDVNGTEAHDVDAEDTPRGLEDGGVTTALRQKLATAKYNKRKQKRLRAELDARELAQKSKRLEQSQRREQTLNAIVAAEAKVKELTALASKMARALKRAPGATQPPRGAA